MAISPLLPVLSLFLSFSLLFCDFFFGIVFFSWVGGGGGQGLVFTPGAFTNCFGPREVFITRAFFHPIWTLLVGV